MIKLDSSLYKVFLLLLYIMPSYLGFSQWDFIQENDEVRFNENYYRAAMYDGEIFITSYYFLKAEGTIMYHYDGSWDTFTPNNSDILHREVFDILEYDGDFYFATLSGLSIKSGSNWTHYSPSNSNIPDSLLRVNATEAGIVVVSPTELSFLHKDSTDWTTISHIPFANNFSPIQPLLAKRPLITNSTIFYRSKAYDINNQSFTTINDDLYNHFYYMNDQAFVFSLNDYPGVWDNDTFLYLTDAGICAFDFSNVRNVNGSALQVFNNEGTLFYSTNQINATPEFNECQLVYIKDGKYQIGKGLPWKPKDNVILVYDRASDSIYDLKQGLVFTLQDYIDYSETESGNIEILDINQVSAPIVNTGELFYDRNNRNVRYKVPQEDCKSPIFSQSLWIGGLDDNDDVRLAAMTYRQRGQDFWPGPLDEDNGSFDPQDSIDFNRLWKVSKSEIQTHLNIYNANGSVPEGLIPEAILNWPAKGNVDQDLAPFYDQNADGVYEPTDGDYPLIKGDQAIFWVMNDKANIHGETGGNALGIEIHGMAYAFNCPDVNTNDSINGINYTTFYEYTVINRSGNDYSETVIGSFADVDLGNFGDDIVGSHVTQNMGFVHNGDSIDNGPLGYGLNPPMLSMALLDAPGAQGDNIDNDNDGSTDEADELRYMGHFFTYNNNLNPINGNPESDQDFYNYLNAKWMTGDTIKSSTNGKTIRYLNAGPTDPDHPGNTWSYLDSITFASDRRFVLSSHQFDFNAGDVIHFEYAMVYSHDQGQFDQMDKNLTYVNSIKNWYYDEGVPSCFYALGIEDLNTNQTSTEVYPVPNNGSFTVKSNSLITAIELYSTSGVLVQEVDNVNQYELNWNTGIKVQGVYFMVIKTESGSITRKIIITAEL